MNNKIVNLALLAENIGKLDKSKVNINNLFMEIKKILDYLNSEDLGDFKEKRQEFIDKLTPIITQIDEILLKYIDFLRSLIESEKDLESTQASELAKETDEMRRKSGSGGGSSGGSSRGGVGSGTMGGGYTPTNNSGQGSNQNSAATDNGQTSSTGGRPVIDNNRNDLIQNVLDKLRGNTGTSSSNESNRIGDSRVNDRISYVPSGNSYTPPITSGTTSTPSSTGTVTPSQPTDNLSKLSTGGEPVSNKVLDDLLQSNTAPDENLGENVTTLEEQLPTLLEGENNLGAETITQEDRSLTDLSTSPTEEFTPTDASSNSDWLKYAGLGALGLGAVGLGGAALLSKNKKDEELSLEENEESTNDDWSTVDTTGYNNDSFNTTSSNW